MVREGVYRGEGAGIVPGAASNVGAVQGGADYGATRDQKVHLILRFLLTFTWQRAYIAIASTRPEVYRICILDP